MTRTRDRASNMGLLPRMEARARKTGFTYRYHPVGKKPVNLGTDLKIALQAVLDMNHDNSDKNSLNEMWRLYQASDSWKNDLSDGSKTDYSQSSKQLLKRFGVMPPSAIKPNHIARYLRVERTSSPVRANREFALLSNLLNLAVERGDIETNPCKQVRRNKERPRKSAPETANLQIFLEWAWTQKGQAAVLAGMAEFASLGGNRGMEFRLLTWPQVGETEIRIIRGKQREGKEVVEVFPMHGAVVGLMDRMRGLAKDVRYGWVFPNAKGGSYTAQAFKLGWNRLKAAARKAGKLDVNFTFHDLRSYYVTQFKAKFGALPEIHADPGTTARIYDSSKIVNRKML
jgi:integrase